MYDFFYSTEQILDAFFRISTLLTFPSRVDDILQRILDDVVETMGFHRGIICLLDEKKENLTTKVVKNYSPEEAKYAFSTNLNIYKHDSLETRVAKSGYYIALEDAETDPRITEADRKITKFYKRGSTFYAALKTQDEVIGIICLWSKEKTRFSDNEIGILLTFANQISIVIHNTRLFEDNQNRIERLVVLQEAVSQLNANYVLDNIHKIVIENALKICESTKALIYFLDVKKDKCLISDGGIVVGDTEEEFMARINQSIIKHALDSEDTIIQTSGNNSGIPSLFKEFESEIAIPLNIAEKFKAVLYLAKPKGSYGPDEVNVLDILVKNAAASYDNAIMHSLLSMEAESLKTKVEMLKKREDELLGFHDIIGNSNKMQGIFHVITEVAKHDTNILIQGESGTGKELMARAIHRQSGRKAKRFVDVNCAAIPGTLLESELFGFEAGAFTDARKRKLGLIEYASGGTMLLDEIGDMNLQLQAKFLRMLEDGHIRRLGGNENIPINVRFIFSTNRDLNRMVSEGLFREDLYYRISVVPITIPPLRERDDDTIILSQHYIEEFNNKFNKKVVGFTKEAEQVLIRYPWPGNVRELKNIIERVMILQNVGAYITKDNLPAEIKKAAKKELPASADDDYSPYGYSHPVNYKLLIEQLTAKIKERILERTLELSNGNKTVAARRLGISRYTLIRELKKLEKNDNSAKEIPAI
ncbi:MAG TPA: sigma-54-dependent Fis family transcriptional regulator [Deltaproteobacteria bacterium]|nr:sigma-54-dependent Fis family transcriptional regulator [Deltaproteobacteria bacterium]